MWFFNLRGCFVLFFLEHLHHLFDDSVTCEARISPPCLARLSQSGSEVVYRPLDLTSRTYLLTKYTRKVIKSGAVDSRYVHGSLGPG